MNADLRKFTLAARAVHWITAVLVLGMLGIGGAMVSIVSPMHSVLENVHRPVGVLLWLLTVVRLILRQLRPPPALPADLPPLQRAAARWSHRLLYVLLLTLPLVGWGMVSAGGYPVMLSANLQLPSILPADPAAFVMLRLAHRWLAYALMGLIAVHVGGALHHACVRRDGVMRSML